MTNEGSLFADIFSLSLVHNSEFFENLIKYYCIRPHFDVIYSNKIELFKLLNDELMASALAEHPLIITDGTPVYHAAQDN